MDWHLVYTKTKWEIKVAEKLKKHGIECYCPTVFKERKWRDRNTKIEVPLFLY